MGGGPSYVSQSPASAADASLAEKMWSDYKTKYLPLETQMARQSENFNYRRNIEDAQAASGAMQGVSKATGAIRKRAYGIGINPNSGRGAMIEDPNATEAATTGAVNARNAGVTNENLGKASDVAAVGAGQQANAVRGYQRAADIGTSQAISTADYNNAMDSQVMNAAGTALGTYMYLGGRFGLGNNKIDLSNSAVNPYVNTNPNMSAGVVDMGW